MIFEFTNWPFDPEKDFRVAIGRLFDQGITYNEVLELSRKSYLKIAMLKMKGKPKTKIANRIDIHPYSLLMWMKKYDLEAK